MKLRRTVICLALTLMALPLALEAKKRHWQEGTLFEAERQEISAFPGPIIWPVYWPGWRLFYVWLYTVQTEDMTYELLWHGPEPLNVTVNRKLKFAPGNNSEVYVLDDNGKERKLTLTRKTARSPNQKPDPAHESAPQPMAP